jgi:hypothetical protein
LQLGENIIWQQKQKKQGDLKNLATVIDVASTRGAFRANEMAMVGMVYNKLQSFLAKVSPPEKKEDDTKKSDEKKGE